VRDFDIGAFDAAELALPSQEICSIGYGIPVSVGAGAGAVAGIPLRQIEAVNSVVVVEIT
jgi:hypothetical protein